MDRSSRFGIATERLRQLGTVHTCEMEEKKVKHWSTRSAAVNINHFVLKLSAFMKVNLNICKLCLQLETSFCTSAGKLLFYST
jgi:hypothetical protein